MKRKIKKTNLKKLFLIFILIIITILVIAVITKKDFIIKGLNKETVEVNTKYKLPNIEACYGNKILCQKADVIILKNNLKLTELGEYKVYYKITYQQHSKIVTKSVKVVDTTKPKIKIIKQNLTICPNKKQLNSSIVVTDNYDKSIKNKIEKKFSANKVIIKVKDSSGNETILIKKAIIKDGDKPTIKLNGDKITYIQIGEKYKDDGAKATDICDGNITKKVISKNNINMSKLGTYQVSYQVIDSSANKAINKRIVKVIKKRETVVPKGKTIYLTFDDGPGEYTEKLLNVLKKYNVKATFFVTKNIEKYKEVVKRASDEGHTIGLHTWSHDYSIYKSKKAYFKDLNKLKKEVEQITGKETEIIRFPGGSSNTISENYKIGIMKDLTKEVEKRGFYYYDWNIESNDAGGTTNTKKIVHNITSHLSGQTNIVLQHDIYNYSVKAVEKTIKYGLKKGYKFSRIKETTPGAHHIVNN